MSTRKYISGYEKRKKKQKIEELIQSQSGAFNRFFSSKKKENFVEELVNEELSKEDIVKTNLNEEHEIFSN